jgi:hypothetical protein
MKFRMQSDKMRTGRKQITSGGNQNTCTLEQKIRAENRLLGSEHLVEARTSPQQKYKT